MAELFKGQNVDDELMRMLQTLHLENVNEDNANGQPEIEGTETLVFSPPVFIQRYLAVKDVLQKVLQNPENQDPLNGRTVMEVGCAGFGMHHIMKTIVEIGKIVYLDIDERLLVRRKDNLRPVHGDFLRRASRPKPLAVEAYAGDINFVDPKMLQGDPAVWGVVAVELIEHLRAPDLRSFEISVFGVINPHLVVVTTPNSEFNVMFNLPPGKFRHWDHKFEWSRQEFKAWCLKIIQEYPEYTFSIHGIGDVPSNAQMPLEDIGCVTQMAIFEKVHQPSAKAYRVGTIQEGAYKLIESLEYPNYIETRSLDEVIICDIIYLHTYFWWSKANLDYCSENGIETMEFTLPELIDRLPEQTRVLSKRTQTAIDVPYMKKVLTTSGKYEVLTKPITGEFYIRLFMPDYESRYDHLDFEEDMEEEQG